MLRKMELFFLMFLAYVVPLQGAVVNAPGNGFTRWPSNVIPYKYMGSNAFDNDIIVKAFDTISFDTGGCVNFTQRGRDEVVNEPHLVIQNGPRDPSVTVDICLTFPGYTVTSGNRGQVAIMFSQITGTNTVGGCLDNLRDTIRVLMNAIGVRNEYQRKDRDSFMIFASSGDADRNSLVAPILQKYNIFGEAKKYNDTITVNTGSGFDKDSITMVSGMRFAGSATPVFTTVGGERVGTQFRLSVQDCQNVRQLYSCQGWYLGLPGETGCRDPYANSAGVSFDTEGPAILSRSIHCLLPNSPLVTLPNGGIFLGQLLIKGLLWSATGATPTINIIESFSGLTVEPVAVSIPVSLVGGGNRGAGEPTPCPTITAGASCGWSARFSMTTPPTKGMLNRQIAIDLLMGINFITSLTVTFNINCAPQFQFITANVGYSATMTSTVTKLASGGILAGIATVNVLNGLSAPPWVSAATPTQLTQYTLHYNMRTPFGEPGPPVTGTNQATATPKKVFVNCIVGGATKPLFGGTTAVATVLATDPEGGPVSYYAYSGIPQVATIAAKGVGPGSELHTVTKDGVVFISAYSRTLETAPLAKPEGDDLAGDSAGTFDVSTAAATAPARDVHIVAVDAQGAFSVLQARFFFGCGITV